MPPAAAGGGRHKRILPFYHVDADLPEGVLEAQAEEGAGRPVLLGLAHRPAGGRPLPLWEGPGRGQWWPWGDGQWWPWGVGNGGRGGGQ